MSDDYDEKEASELVQGFVAGKVVDAKADYLSRGRAHHHLSEQELAEQWVTAFREMAVPTAEQKKRRIEADYSLEFELRGMERPDDLVKDDMERYLAHFADKLEAMKRDDPEGWDRLVLELGKDICDYNPAKKDAN
jgi:hypothetical protein